MQTAGCQNEETRGYKQVFGIFGPDHWKAPAIAILPIGLSRVARWAGLVAS
jgi:hypothetical protein